jgi:nucleoside-diphosphate-sugar epimerase
MRLPADAVAQLRQHYQGRPICVTGGAGFIGGHLVDALLSLGADVTVLDDLSNSTLEHLGGLIDLEPDRIRFVQGSILDDDAVAEAMSIGPRMSSGPGQLVFHLAAVGSVPRSIQEPQRTWSVNTTGTLRILEAARKAKASRVVLAASSSAYGDDASLPKVETILPRPMSPYAASKVAAEHLMLSWARSYGLSTASLRYFNIFGPRQPAESAYAAVIPAFVRGILQGEAPVIFGDGQQSRDFTPIDNAVLATLLAGASERPLAGEVFNIGTGRRTTLWELVRLIGSLTGPGEVVPVLKPARAGDVVHSLADITAARTHLRYNVIRTLEQGLADTITWQRQSLANSGS